jgi:hypothetical protein
MNVIWVWESIPHFYEPLRFYLYSSFFTAGSLLLAVQNFLIVNLNRDVYSNDKYQAFIKSQNRKWKYRELTHIRSWWNFTFWVEKVDTSIYGPLIRLAHYLRQSTMIVIFGAVIQLVLGAISHPLASSICLMVASFVVFRIFQVLNVQRRATEAWLDWLQHESDNRDKKKLN